MKLARRLAAVLAVGGIALLPSTANAAALTVVYDASGTSHVASTDSDIVLKPTSLTLGMEVDGTFTGSLPLKPADTKFHVLGFLPIKAQVNFEEAGPLTGSIAYVDGANKVTSTASYYLRLSNVLIGGVPTYVSNNCRTKVPVQIPAGTPAGESFDITTGGRLTGTFTIGKFEHCALNTLLINQIVPGSGNTVELNLSNGRLG